MEAMTAIVDTVGLAHLVVVVERCRRDWNPDGIRAALLDALARHRYADVAVVAIAAARDPGARTPAVIATRLSNGWTGNTATEGPTRTPTPVADMRCLRCDCWTVPGEDHQCRRPADPDTAAHYATLARAAARAGATVARARARSREPST
jgi:hypothetical protein